MGKTNQNQQLLNWLNSERNKDQKEVDFTKSKIIEEIKKIKKDEMFPKPKKISIWKKIRVMILGN
jgi:hypothetical protein